MNIPLIFLLCSIAMLWVYEAQTNCYISSVFTPVSSWYKVHRSMCGWLRCGGSSCIYLNIHTSQNAQWGADVEAYYRGSLNLCWGKVVLDYMLTIPVARVNSTSRTTNWGGAKKKEWDRLNSEKVERICWFHVGCFLISNILSKSKSRVVMVGRKSDAFLCHVWQ